MTSFATKPAVSNGDTFTVRQLGCMQYTPVWQAMQSYNSRRGAQTPDEIWLVEHPPVYTLGLNCKSATITGDNTIPVVHTDRGGQITYHGPGQIVAYVLMDLKRKGIGVKQLVHAMEQSVIDLLKENRLEAVRRQDAPGVYVNGAKIAALGLRVRRGGSYHGIALNVDMDLEPFTRIDPCGYAGLATTQLKDLGVSPGIFAAGFALVDHLVRALGYNGSDHNPDKPEELADA